MSVEITSQLEYRWRCFVLSAWRHPSGRGSAAIVAIAFVTAAQHGSSVSGAPIEGRSSAWRCRCSIWGLRCEAAQVKLILRFTL